MKNLIQLSILNILFLIGFSCTKNKDITALPVSSVTVVNAVVGSSPIITDYSGAAVSVYYSTTPRISYGSYKQFSIPSGITPFVAYQSTDTINPVYKADLHSGGLDLNPQGVYSLFLCGQATPTLQSDTVFVTDNLPYHSTADSSIGIRFINLSAGSSPVNVTLSTSATVNEFGSIAYKSVTDFKNYPAVASTTLTSYTFQIRDAATDSVLAAYTMSGINNGAGANTSANNYRFRNFTIALIGVPGGAGSTSQKAILINNY